MGRGLILKILFKYHKLICIIILDMFNTGLEILQITPVFDPDFHTKLIMKDEIED